MSMTDIARIAAALDAELERRNEHYGLDNWSSEEVVRFVLRESLDYEVAMDALVPFVQAGVINGNPEELELIAHAVLDHMTPEEVVRMINDDRAAHQRMLDAWQRDIEAHGETTDG